MKFMKLAMQEQVDFMAALAAMPAWLEQSFAGFSCAELGQNGPSGEFAAVEQVWHLADLEQDGFAARIEHLLLGLTMQMPDFDGDAVAKERNYKALDFAEGIRKFSEARKRNIATLRNLQQEEWTRAGQLEGVGPISLCDIPALLFQHDRAHKAEIALLRNHIRR